MFKDKHKVRINKNERTLW